MLHTCWRLIGHLLEHYWKTIGELFKSVGESLGDYGGSIRNHRTSIRKSLDNYWKTIGKLLGDLLENYWQTHLLPLLTSNGHLESGLSNLIDLANEYNGHDNITAILIRVRVFPR